MFLKADVTHHIYMFMYVRVYVYCNISQLRSMRRLSQHSRDTWAYRSLENFLSEIILLFKIFKRIFQYPQIITMN